MTDRHSGYVVTLQRPIREDEAENIMNALRLIRGVVDVQPVPEDGVLHGFTAAVRAEARWRDAVFNLAMNGPAIEGK